MSGYRFRAATPRKNLFACLYSSRRFAAVATLYIASIVLIPVALAILFTFLLAPLVAAVERIRLPRATSALLVVVLGVAAVGAVGLTVAKQLVSVTEQLPNYTTNIREKIASLRNSRNNQLAKASDTVKELLNELAEGSAATPATPRAGRTLRKRRVRLRQKSHFPCSLCRYPIPLSRFPG